MPVPASRTTHGAGSLETSPDDGGPRAAPGSDASNTRGSAEVARRLSSGPGPPLSGVSSPSSAGVGLLPSLPIGAIAVVVASNAVCEGSDGSDGDDASSAVIVGPVACAWMPSSEVAAGCVVASPPCAGALVSTTRLASVVTALTSVVVVAASSASESGGGGGGVATVGAAGAVTATAGVAGATTTDCGAAFTRTTPRAGVASAG